MKGTAFPLGRRRLGACRAATMLFTLFAGCSDNLVGVDPQRVHEVELQPDSVLFASLGDTASLTATVRSFLGGVLNRTVLWSTDDDMVASVDDTGTVMAEGNGATFVRAILEGKVDSTVVIVRQAVASTAAQGDRQSGAPGSTLGSPITVTILDANGVAIVGADAEFSVFSGGGSVTTSSSSTDATGSASTEWTLGPTVGLQELDVVVGFQQEASLRITATAN